MPQAAIPLFHSKHSGTHLQSLLSNSISIPSVQQTTSTTPIPQTTLSDPHPSTSTMPSGFPAFRFDPTAPLPSFQKSKPSTSEQTQRYRDSPSEPKEGVKLSKYQYPTERGKPNSSRVSIAPMLTRLSQNPSQRSNRVRKSRAVFKDCKGLKRGFDTTMDVHPKLIFAGVNAATMMMALLMLGIGLLGDMLCWCD